MNVYMLKIRNAYATHLAPRSFKDSIAFRLFHIFFCLFCLSHCFQASSTWLAFCAPLEAAWQPLEPFLALPPLRVVVARSKSARASAADTVTRTIRQRRKTKTKGNMQMCDLYECKPKTCKFPQRKEIACSDVLWRSLRSMIGQLLSWQHTAPMGAGGVTAAHL